MVCKRDIIHGVLAFMGKWQQRSHHGQANSIRYIYRNHKGFTFGFRLQESQGLFILFFFLSQFSMSDIQAMRIKTVVGTKLPHGMATLINTHTMYNIYDEIAVM